MQRLSKKSRMIKGLDAFTLAYITCALWSSTDSNDEPLDKAYGFADLAESTLQTMIDECRRFQDENGQYFQDLGQAGHDLWLTRNHHGAGYWDRGYLDGIGDLLTDRAHAYGSCDLYVGDDGQIYL